MKKLISLVCMVSIMASILAPVASAINLSNEAQTVRYSTEIAGKQADVEYRLENGEVTYAKITAGENVTERIGNIIYLNGVKMATIHEEPANYEDETVTALYRLDEARQLFVRNRPCRLYKAYFGEE